MKDIIMKAQGLRWHAGSKTIIDIPEIEIERGQQLALIGPNGSGKSSLLKLLALLEKPSQGHITFSVPDLPPNSSLVDKRRRMAVVFQEPLLLNLTVWDNVAYGLKLRGYNKQVIRGRVGHWLDVLKISHLGKRHPRNLSGGEAQRVSIARALAVEPDLLFLDEPFSALDSPTKAQLLEDISGVLKDSKVTSIFITHDFNEIPFLAQRVVVLSGGKVVQKGSLEEIFYHPGTAEVAELVGAEILCEGMIERVGESLIISLRQGQNLYIPPLANINPDIKVRAYSRPENVRIGQGESNNFLMKVVKIGPHGFNYKLTLQGPVACSLVLTKEEFFELRPSIGKEIQTHIPPHKIHLIRV